MSNETQTLKPVGYSIATEFGLPNIPPTVQLMGLEPGHPAAPKIDQAYVFDPNKLRDFFAFWQAGLPAMKLIGDPGAGKTSIVEQFHARLRLPLYRVACRPDTEGRDLIGKLVPTTAGNLEWRDGPVLKAAREGTSVLLDEYNILEPGCASSLNMLLDGYALTIDETGETVSPKEGFRVFATENSVYSNLAITGRNVQDAANDDRWMVVYCDYMPESLEVAAIEKKLVANGLTADKAQLISSSVIKVVQSVRQAYRDGDPVIDKPLTTRAAVRWGILMGRLAGVKDPDGPMIYSLKRAVQMSPEMSKAVVTATKVTLGVS
jgi:cobaltochelatase CobS